MLENEDARVSFAVVGVLLVIVSTIVTVYLVSMESVSVSQGIGDDRDRDISRALTLAVADIGTALNYAGLAAEAEAGKSPVVLAGNDSDFARGAACIDDERIKYLAWRELSGYLEANFNGSFTYGDYQVSAVLTGDYRSLGIDPGNMTLGRKFDHPLIPCRIDYTAYYTLTAPVRLTIVRPGSDFAYSEDRVIRSLITARYPLLRDLTGEYERRLNGTPADLDLTAASFAITWTRGYAQYASGSPLNIVGNAQLELIVNGALLTEQGFEYSSVDPIGLVTLAYKCLGNTARPSEVNSYDIGNNSKAGLPGNGTAAPPEKYAFDAADMVDRAYENVSFGGYAENTLDGAYTMQMHVEIARELDCYPLINATYTTEERSESAPAASPGERPLLTRTFRVYRDNDDGKGFADRVTVTYFATRYSVLQFFGAGKYADSSERLHDPLLAGSYNDVASPFDQYVYEKDLDFGHKAFTDDNLRDAIKWYEASFDRPGETGRFEKILSEIVEDRDGWQERVPAAFTDGSYEFVCGPDNRHPMWAEIEADYELRDLCKTLKKEVTVDLDPESYGGSPAAMTDAAYRMLDDMFRKGYDRYLDRPSYFCTGSQPDYRSCGSKAIFRLRQAFLADLGGQLDDAARNAGEAIDSIVRERMNGTGLNESDLTTGAASAKSYMKERVYIPFGLAMKLNSSAEFAQGYPWVEDVSLAVDQSPSYLDTGVHTDEETGYSVRTLRLRNVCLFAPAADLPSTGKIADAMAGPILTGIDAMAAGADRLSNATVIAKVKALTEDVSSGARDLLKKEIEAALGTKESETGAVRQGSVNDAVERAYDRRANDGSAVVRDLCNGTLAQEIAGDIINASASDIRENARNVAAGYVDEYQAYVVRITEEKVAGAAHKAIAQVTGKLKDEIGDTFRDFSSAATEKILEGGADAALEKALGLVPSGLPLLPPWGWWATLNVWYIEVQGEIPVFTVYDTDVEPVPDPVFGGRAIAYTRRHDVIRDDRGRTIGTNEPLRFSLRTGTFILVPPGTQGVGDKSGGRDEKSPGFSEKEGTG
ncbi:MAG TPA: hypothetical protein VGJ92_10625 [Methanocella sp.]|jgi:hypothetical protein